ncbi:CPBP family intramembrane glutamic endopeptidase [Pseudonocardia hispaniensis]|uniref:CPBP family intramembrane glutamic endopeptidase n=1 Tax=Pseudonocardia hispaniensis TaxID=904933 RepID=A0ABW1J358_9PSEU
MGAYALVEVVFLASSLLLGLLVLRDGPLGVTALAIGLAVPTVLAAGLAILITVRRGNGPRIDLGLRFSWRDVGIGLAFGFGGLVLTIPASVIYASLLGPDRATSSVGEVFAGLSSGVAGALVVFVIVVFLAPVCEEIVYRGLLWGALERHGAGRWVAFGLTTLLFALAHFEFSRTPLLAVIAIPIGLARVVTGGLTASIVAHQINNLLPGIALLLMLLGVVPS